MGSGFSSVCSSNRSVVIANSVRQVRDRGSVPSIRPAAPDQRLPNVPGKLRPCISRDSGIVENEIPHGQSTDFSRSDSDLNVHEDTGESSDSDETIYSEKNSVHTSRPHSCRLGDRRRSQKLKDSGDSLVAEDRLVQYLRASRSLGTEGDFDENIPSSRIADDGEDDDNDEDSFYGNCNNNRKNYSRSSHKRKSSSRLRSGRSVSKRSSTVTESYEDSDSDSENYSDSDFWTIPDETGMPSKKTDDRNRKGWVTHEDRTSYDNYSSSGSMTPTPRSSQGQTLDYYRIRMDDLVEAFLDALQDKHEHGELSQSEYEIIMRNLRHQLVDFVFTCIANDITPRVEIQANTQSLFTDPGTNGNSSWTVEIQLKTSDEEILQTSEKQLAQKLVQKGSQITREDIAILLGDHLRTIEQLQHVRDSGRLQQADAVEDKHRLTSAPSPRKGSANMSSKRKKVPSSAPNKSSRSEKGRISGNHNVLTNCLRPQTKDDDLPGRVQVCTVSDGFSNEENSDSTIENLSDSEQTRSIRKSASLDERRLRQSKHFDQALDENDLSQRVSEQIWDKWRTLADEEFSLLIAESRDCFIQTYGQYLEEPCKVQTHTNLTTKPPLHPVKPATSSASPTNPRSPDPRSSEGCIDIANELWHLDSAFIQNVQEQLAKDAISRASLETLVLEHMRKTSVIRVKAITVGPAPLTRTRSLTDAVDGYRSQNSSAGSTISRRSEPDFRKYTVATPEYEDLWGSNDKLNNNRTSSARRNAPRAVTSRRRSGQTQVHGLSHMEPLNEGVEESSMPKVEEIEGKLSVKSRPDSGIAVSMSSGSYSSYSSSEVAKETDDIDEACITESSEMRDRLGKVNADLHNDMKSLAAAITKGLTSQQHKAHALYYWLTNLGIAKYARSSKGKNTPSGKLKQLVDKKISYAQLYIDLCKASGLKCEKIDGYVKNKDFLPGNTVQTSKCQHTWNAIHIDGQYRFVDPAYGARREKFFMDHYFLTSPDELILSHFPKEKKWHLMNNPISLDGFEQTVKTWPAMFHFNIRPLNMKAVIRTYDGKLSITVLLQNVAVIPQLDYSGPGPEIDSDALVDCIDEEIRDNENAETFHISLPREGNYYFTLLGHVLEDEVDVPVFQYRIEYTDELL
ncbi:serine-rich adhesin for platelets-like isoform X2 [Argopecten irradians]|uniref:serine-rich adhesin for platelets-like isoform X2 n=1 Tax=Argopecten irradians TaxID=31199 RepID=UPI00371CCDB3